MRARGVSAAVAVAVVSCQSAELRPSDGANTARATTPATPPAVDVARPPPPGRPPPGLRAAVTPAAVESTYLQPSADVVALVDARPTPHLWVSPRHDRIVLADYDAHPAIAVVSRPFERLAGLRIDAARNAARRTRLYEALTVVSVADGAKTTVDLPDGAQLSAVRWAPDGQRLALGRWAPGGVELWVADAATGATSRVGNRHLNTVFGAGVSWMPGSHALLVQLVPEGHGPPPPTATVPVGPTTMDTQGVKATNRTYQDLLHNRADEALFQHLATSSVAIVDLDGGATVLGDPDLYLAATASPDGTHILVERLKTPFSYAVPYSRFARSIEVRDLKATVVRVVADQAAAEAVPMGGVRAGARGVHWLPTADATLAWREALDGGDPDAEADYRDRLMTHAAPFADTPEERLRTPQRLSRVAWTQRPAEVLVTQYDRDRRWATTYLFGPDAGGPAGSPQAGARVVFDRSVRDAYGDPGRPVYTTLPTGHRAVAVDEGQIYLAGSGATPEGDRPFLRRVDLATGSTEELMRASGEEHVAFVDFGSVARDAWIVRRETARTPPDFYVEGAGGKRRLTTLPHPHPQLSGIQKRLLKYTRADGVALSGTLYLPPAYDDTAGAEPLPLVVWAYPVEYNDPDTAGQVRAAPKRFTRLRALSPLMFLTQGYAVLSPASMPVIGDPETMNDTFLAQIADSAQAAIDACVAAGVADPERVGVGGHSYGAFMAANLLAHTDLFRAGIARSGAYNRSLTPFGFQSERRTLWEAPQTYVQVSPLFSAHTIDEPILLIHGEVDSNAGTYPLQSKRLFHALKGVGGTARLVLLPHESHGYAARESVLHVLAESFAWFDTHVKNAAPRIDPAGPG